MNKQVIITEENKGNYEKPNSNRIKFSIYAFIADIY